MIRKFCLQNVFPFCIFFFFWSVFFSPFVLSNCDEDGSSSSGGGGSYGERCLVFFSYFAGAESKSPFFVIDMDFVCELQPSV